MFINAKETLVREFLVKVQEGLPIVEVWDWFVEQPGRGKAYKNSEKAEDQADTYFVWNEGVTSATEMLNTWKD